MKKKKETPFTRKRFSIDILTCAQETDLYGMVQLSFADFDKVDYSDLRLAEMVAEELRERKDPEELYGYEEMAKWAVAHENELFGWDDER